MESIRPSDEELDAVFEPTIEESILASGAHQVGRLNSPEGGESLEGDFDL